MVCRDHINKTANNKQNIASFLLLCYTVDK